MTDQLQSDVLVCVPMDDETRALAAAYVRRQPTMSERAGVARVISFVVQSEGGEERVRVGFDR